MDARPLVFLWFKKSYDNTVPPGRFDGVGTGREGTCTVEIVNTGDIDAVARIGHDGKKAKEN